MSFSSSSGNKTSFFNYDELVKKDLKPGDLIEIDRGTYNHWAMFSNKSDNGTHWCFHVTTTEGDFEKNRAFMSSVSARKTAAGIKKHKLKDILEDNDSKMPSHARINNKIDEAKRKKCVPLPIEQVIEHLEKLKDEPVEYSLTDSNCEHFVTNWKYGAGWSRQVDVATVVVGSAFLAVTTGVVFTLIYSIFGGGSRSTKYEDVDEDD